MIWSTSVVIFWFYLNFRSIREILNLKSYLSEWNTVIVFRTFGSCDFSIETMFNIRQTGWYITCYVWFSVIGEFFICTQFQCIFCGPVWGLHFSCPFHLVPFLLSSIHEKSVQSYLFLFHHRMHWIIIVLNWYFLSSPLQLVAANHIRATPV